MRFLDRIYILLLILFIGASPSVYAQLGETSKELPYQVLLSPGINFTQFRSDTIDYSAIGAPSIGVDFRYPLYPWLQVEMGTHFARRGSDVGYLVDEYRNDYMDMQGFINLTPGSGLGFKVGYRYSVLVNSFTREFYDILNMEYVIKQTSWFENQRGFMLGVDMRLVKGLWVQFLYLVPDAQQDYYSYQFGVNINIHKLRKGKRLNKYTSLDDALANPYACEKLVLQRDRLTAVPPEVFSLPNLEELVLDGNSITSLPPEIGNMKKLRRLSIQYNDLDSLPSELGLLRNLEELNLSYNKLQYLPKEIGNLTGMKFLYIGKNSLRELPEEIGELKNLIELDVARSGVMLEIPESVGTIRSLERLYIDRTTYLPYDFSRSNMRLQILLR